MGALMLVQTCSLSLAKSFMREALQGLAVICFVCKNSTSVHGFVMYFSNTNHRNPFLSLTASASVWEVCSVVFKFPDVKMCRIMLMTRDPVLLSSAIRRDRSGEGTSQKGVTVNFPGLGLGPISFSDVTVLGFSLEEPAVAILAVLPGRSRCCRSMEMWKSGFGMCTCPERGWRGNVVNPFRWINKSDKPEYARSSKHFFLCLVLIVSFNLPGIYCRGSMLTSWHNMMAL